MYVGVLGVGVGVMGVGVSTRRIPACPFKRPTRSYSNQENAGQRKFSTRQPRQQEAQHQRAADAPQAPRVNVLGRGAKRREEVSEAIAFLLPL